MSVNPVSLSVIPCAAAMVELPDNERTFVRVSFAVASSSPPLKATVPAPRAPPLPKASLPPASATLPIVFALLSDTNPESTVSAPNHRERAGVFDERGLGSIEGQGIREIRAADRDNVRSSRRYGDSVRQARDCAGRPVRGDAPIAAGRILPIDSAHISLPIFCTASGLHAGIRGLIVQKQTKEDGLNWLGFSPTGGSNGPLRHRRQRALRALACLDRIGVPPKLQK
jgi:hypothetical protein